MAQAKRAAEADAKRLADARKVAAAQAAKDQEQMDAIRATKEGKERHSTRIIHFITNKTYLPFD